MTHDEMIAVIQAHKEGKKIESRPKGYETWAFTDKPRWDFGSIDYRVKPEPREWWINVYSRYGSCCNMHPTLEAAVNGSKGEGPDIIERIHVREVIE